MCASSQHMTLLLIRLLSNTVAWAATAAEVPYRCQGTIAQHPQAVAASGSAAVSVAVL
jgi:hypothetical protein